MKTADRRKLFATKLAEPWAHVVPHNCPRRVRQ